MMSLACLIATVQLGAPSAAAVAKEVPIKGKLQSVESFDFQFATLFVDGSGSGNATHLGWYTVTYEWEVDLQTLVGIGTFHFIAANGDSLFTEATGVAIPTEDPDVLFTEAMHTIVGGTGRFEGAGGEFTAVGLLNAVTGVRSDTLRGTLIK
jgi:hypothetical protein